MNKKSSEQNLAEISKATPKEFLAYFKDHKVVKSKCSIEADGLDMCIKFFDIK